MSESSLFLDKNKINKFDEIIRVILTESLSPGTISIEHIGDIISFLNKRDKVREMSDPELKMAVFRIIKTLLDMDAVELLWQDSWVEKIRNSPPSTEQEVFEVLNEYWYKSDVTGLDKNYLLYFKKKGQTWP